jgi:Fe-Mn family superoxide dismutase
MAFKLPDLPYSFDALEPHIDAKTMEIHHDKHHAAYVAKLNAALEKKPELQGKGVEELVKSLETIPQDLRTAVRNHGGGHFNHSLFWELMSPKGGGQPAGALFTALAKSFGTFDSFKDLFSASAANHFGSGWAWLGVNESKRLVVVTCANQDPPFLQGIQPILGIDVWEHAYYLKYQNRRPEYITAFWNVVNWKKAEELFDKAMK